jgi:hypothetical protein
MHDSRFTKEGRGDGQATAKHRGRELLGEGSDGPANGYMPCWDAKRLTGS